MLLIRRFEEEVQRRFLKGEVHGTTHLCNGQEAIAVGVAAGMKDRDLLAATYRGHGHALARGLDPGGLATELMGRVGGTCAGRAGSMNVLAPEQGLIGCFGIVGGSIGAATGAALALRGSGRIAVACFGEGATNQAYFAECLNFAKVLSLPLLLVCENNGYGEFTAWEAVTAGADIQARVQALAVPAQRIDGNDVLAVHDATQRAATVVRGGGGPAFLEMLTYRQVGHSRSDPGNYRPSGELEQWLLRDPLRFARSAIEQQGLADARALARLQDSVEQDVRAAFERAAASPFPDPAELAAASEYCDA
jgi:TPP-dependent pyruvate/acetoin dehydrogenase alpha subunit